ncbi:MAG: RimK/LysX family protein [Thermodesulfobacteriota bacterium]
MTSSRLLLLICLVVLLLPTMAWGAGCRGKMIIGETARFLVREAGLSYLARIDTGAEITSLHAEDLKVHSAGRSSRANIGKKISFTTRNGRGDRRRLVAEIVDLALVRNTKGYEERYEVELTLVWQRRARRLRVNLCDRGAMNNRLLIGRNFLSPDCLVDVTKKER